MTTPDLHRSADERADFHPLAAHYDAFTNHPRQLEWFRRLESLARRHGLTGKRALDVGCGTGKSTLPLVELGYDVVAADPCDQMLALAADRLGDSTTLFRSAAETLPQLGQFDYISCVNDVCNYILDPERLAAAFKAMAANLADDGILLFDINTPVTYRDFFATTHYSDSPAGKLIWHGFSADEFAPGQIIEAKVEIFEPEGDLWHHRAIRHAQRHHEPEMVEKLLTDAGLWIDALYGQTDAGPPEQPVEPNRHTKALYVTKLI